VVAMYLRGSHLGLGITTEMAAIGTCALGMLCREHPQVAGVLALLLTVLLAAKRFTHATVRKTRRVELTATLKFLVIVVIALPLLPDRTIDPYGAFNPYKTLFLVVLISGISFVGYFLTRWLGPRRGLGLTGILGGLTSSTAVTAAMAQRTRPAPELAGPATVATLAANATMYLRLLVVVLVLDRALALRLAWPLAVMAAVAVGLAVVFWVRSRSVEKSEPRPVALQNPFSLGPAIKFAAFFVAILFVAKLAQQAWGDQGLYFAALLSGLADVDAITLSLVDQTRDRLLSLDVAALGITLAVVANTLVKSGIAVYSGGWRYGRRVGACLIAATGAGLLLALVLPS